MFKYNDNDYNLPNFKLKKGYDKSGNNCIIFQKKDGEIKINNVNYANQNIAVYINDEIYLEFEKCSIEKKNKYEISFMSDDQWSINMTTERFDKNDSHIYAYISSISCKKGKFDKNNVNRSFHFIENLDLNNHDEKLKINNLQNMKLIVRNYQSIFNINGCFYFEDKNCNKKYETAIDKIKHLLNYYSADLASMRISCKCCDDNNSFELNFNPISKYNHFNCDIPFINLNPGNFAKFINSAYLNYCNYNDQTDKINYIIDYLSYLHREQYGDVQIAISCMVLEMFNNFYETNINPATPAFIQKLNNVLNELELDSEKLDSFFRRKGLLCNDNIVSELYAIRNQAFHGKTVSDIKISALLSSFVTILFLKLLKIDCLIQLPICGSETINTKEFVTKFSKEPEKRNGNHDNPKNRILELNGKYYFPLEDIKNANIAENDEYELVEFNKKSNIMLFREIDN